MTGASVGLSSVTLDGKPCHVGQTLSLWTDIELIDVTTSISRSVPDPDWTEVDERGHFHAWSRQDQEWTTPTLTTKRIEIPASVCELDDCECEPEDDDSYTAVTVCRICDQEIAPGMLSITPSPNERRQIPGRKSWGVAGVLVPIEDYRSFVTPRVIRMATAGLEYWGIVVPPGFTQHEIDRDLVRVDLTGTGPLGRRRVKLNG